MIGKGSTYRVDVARRLYLAGPPVLVLHMPREWLVTAQKIGLYQRPSGHLVKQLDNG